MSFRLFLGVALTANILVLVICTGETTETSSTSSASSTTQVSSYSSERPTSQITSKPKPRKCPKVKKCPKNEEFSYCPQSLQRKQYCSEKGQLYTKYSQGTTSCKEACVCKENYLRADNGTCIPEKQCPITCGLNEVLHNCPVDCESDYCPFSDEITEACETPEVCPSPACKCAFNHRRAFNGSCIPTKNCPPFDCSAKPNEEYNACPPLCPTDDCSQASPGGQCPELFGQIGIVLTCNPKCRCIKGYWRLDGICVPYGQCPGVCPANERYSECIQGECRALNCTQKDQSISCPRIRPGFCLKGCVCEEGYLRAEDGTCVKEDQCPKTCPVNEEYVQCIQGVCRAMNCSQKGEDVPCPDVPTEKCDPGCICKENYLRADNGSCVPEDQCQSNPCQKNEVFSNCTQASCKAEKCSQKGMPIACSAVAEGDCIQGCLCRENYLRDESGSCVPEDQCPPNICPPSEEWSLCAQATCRAQNCTQKGEPAYCPSIAEGSCIEACVCKESYLRDEFGYCIPEDQCPSTFDCSAEALGRPNEVYDPCPAICPTDDCSLPRVKGQCPYKLDFVLNCNPKCQCKDGYGRNNGICVPFEECPDLCPANAEYSPCIQATCRPQNCSDRDVMGPCPAYDADSCEKGCVCQENYYRNEQGDCVSYEKCGAKICPINEEWSWCAQATCRAENCTQKGKPIACASIAEGFCIERCVCREGYLRDETGSCVLEDQCPPAVTCGENEILDNCPTFCTSDYCPKSANEEPMCFQPEPCLPDCKCRLNYKRAENRTCIPTRSCPPFDCSAETLGRPNEVYNPCPVLCPTDECSLPRVKGKCPYKIGTVLICNPKCQCKDGYGRVNGICVPFYECPGLCPANEKYSPCIQASCRPQNCSDRDDVMGPCPAYDADSCEKGCVCQDNYYRNEQGDCVSYEECGGPLCPNANEVYTTNMTPCPPNTCESLVTRYACPKNQTEEPGCMCQPGYLRLYSDCVPICDCPQMANSPDC